MRVKIRLDEGLKTFSAMKIMFIVVSIRKREFYEIVGRMERKRRLSG